MYYTEDDLPEQNTCYVFDFKWATYLKNIPDKEASTLPKDQPGSEMKMDMGPIDVNEPVVEEVIVPPKEEPEPDADDEAEEEEEEKEPEEDLDVEENHDEDPDPRK